MYHHSYSLDHLYSVREYKNRLYSQCDILSLIELPSQTNLATICIYRALALAPSANFDKRLLVISMHYSYVYSSSLVNQDGKKWHVNMHNPMAFLIQHRVAPALMGYSPPLKSSGNSPYLRVCVSFFFFSFFFLFFFFGGGGGGGGGEEALLILTALFEYNVLLHHLYASGINGKTWRLIKSWYSYAC